MDLAAWVERVARDSDRDAFAALFAHFAPRLGSYFMRLGCPAPTGEELVQEAMLSLWQQAIRYQPERAAVSTWVFTIARNLSIDRQRREKRFEPSPEYFIGEPGYAPGSDDAAQCGEQHRELERAVRMLAPEQVEILKMFYFQWRSTREIATLTGLPEGTVKSRMRLALKRLRSIMKEDS